MRVPSGVPAPAVTLAGVAAFSVLVALVFALAGGLGHWSNSPAARATVSAEVVTGTPCDRADAAEEVSFSHDGVERRASLDACGHRPGETVEITAGAEAVVHLAEATAGATVDARPAGVVLMVFAGIAGAGFVELWRRRP